MSLMSRSPKSGAVEEKSTVGSNDVTALLQKGSTFEGKLVFEGTVHINGTFKGEIRSKDTLVIGEGAQVEGELDVGTLVVNGSFTGTVRAHQLVEMHPPARVHGTVITPALQIHRGVIFEGVTKMENLDKAALPAPAAAPASNPPPAKVAKAAG
jgi:cytoskeletal protein CcmA (bactofilin family)